MNNIRDVIRPGSVAEAWEARQKQQENSRYLAGGIDITLLAPASVTTVIDLAALGLSAIREDGGDLVVGATATLAQVRESPLARSFLNGFLWTVLGHVASPLQRNLGTIGGTIASAHPWSDVIPALLVLDARLSVYDGGEREVPLESFLRERADGSALLITAVRLGTLSGETRAAFEAYTRTAFDVAMLNCACRVSGRADRCEEVRVAVGGTPALAARVPEVEALLLGQALSGDAIGRAAAAAATAVAVRDDRRATAEYRRTLVQVAVRRCLTRIAEGNGGTDR